MTDNEDISIIAGNRQEREMSPFEPFGQVAVRLGLVTPRGRKLLGMILLEIGLISSGQLIEILQYYDHHRSAANAPTEGETQTSKEPT